MHVPTFPADAKGMATRVSGGKVLNAFAKHIPWLLGGSADLAPSTKTLLTFDEAGGDFSADNPAGRNLHFGIREHGMAAAVNGMVLCGLRAYGATFFVFTDYCRPSLRLAAIMGIPSIIVFTHDSIGVGEDGPTHQPIEHLAACRAIPRLLVLRPGDANEAAVRLADRARANRPAVDAGAHAAGLADARSHEVSLPPPASPAAATCWPTPRGKAARRHPHVHRQRSCNSPSRRTRSSSPPASAAASSACRRSSCSTSSRPRIATKCLPPQVTARVAVEAGIRQCWDKYLGTSGAFVGLDTYGASAPFKEIYKHRGLTAEAVVAKARELCRKK